MDYEYPLRFKSSKSGSVYDFINITIGILVSSPNTQLKVGRVSEQLVHHTDTDWWVPVETLTTKRKLHNALGGFRCHT